MKTKKINTVAILAVFGLATTNSGCSSVGNIIISPHPLSLKENAEDAAPAKLTLIPKEGDSCIGSSKEEKKGYLPPIAAGIVVAGVQKFLEEEAKQYSASYSASDYFSDLECLESIDFKRGKEPLYTFSAKLKKERTSFRLDEGIVEIKGVKSKVAMWPVLTLYHGTNPLSGDSWSSKIGNFIGFVNPFMIFHAIYGVFDDDIYKVNTQVKIRIDTVGLNLNQTALTNLADISFPGGEIDIRELSREKVLTNLRKDKSGYLETGYLAFPVRAKAFETIVDTFPTNVVVAVIEGNDFGDIVGKGEKLVGDNKEKIVDKIKGN